MTQVQHECYTNGTSATQVKDFDFDHSTSKNIFSHPYISYIANDRLQGEEQFHSNSYVLEMTTYHAKMRFEKCTAKSELCNGKSYIKNLCTSLYLQMPLNIPE